MNRIIFMISAICLAGMAAAQNAGVEGNATMTVLSQDSGANITQMDITLYTVARDWGADLYSVGEAVKFTAPRSGWRLKQVRILGHNGFNGTALPIPENFLIEVRDGNLNLLYQFADTQNAYFTYTSPVLRAIDVPALPLSGDFYVIFYDRGTMKIGMETENGTGNSYFYVYGGLIPAQFKIENSEAVNINWVIRAVGE